MKGRINIFSYLFSLPLGIFAVTIILPAILSVNATALYGATEQHYKYYQVDNVQTISGEIVKLKQEACYPNKKHFTVIYLKEKKSGQIYRIEVSPNWFFTLDLFEGSRIEVTGSHSQEGDNHFVITQSITYQGEIHRFRDEHGFPLWRGKGKRMKRGNGSGRGNRRRGRH